MSGCSCVHCTVKGYQGYTVAIGRLVKRQRRTVLKASQQGRINAVHVCRIL
jgi:hypothetical protein